VVVREGGRPCWPTGTSHGPRACGEWAALALVVASGRHPGRGGRARFAASVERFGRPARPAERRRPSRAQLDRGLHARGLTDAVKRHQFAGHVLGGKPRSLPSSKWAAARSSTFLGARTARAVLEMEYAQQRARCARSQRTWRALRADVNTNPLQLGAIRLHRHADASRRASAQTVGNRSCRQDLRSAPARTSRAARGGVEHDPVCYRRMTFSPAGIRFDGGLTPASDLVPPVAQRGAPCALDQVYGNDVAGDRRILAAQNP